MTVFEIVLQFVGFLFQAAPIPALMTAAFEPENMKYPFRKTLFIIVLPVAAGALAFPLWEYALLDSGYVNALSNLYMAACAVLSATLYFRLIKAPAISRVLVLIILVHYAAILFTATNILLSAGSASTTSLVYGVYSVGYNLVLTVLTLPVVYLFLVRIVRPSMQYLDNKIMRRGCVYTGLALALYAAAVMLFDFLVGRAELRAPEAMFFFGAFIATDCILCYMFFSEAKLIASNERLKNKLQNFDEQYRHINRSIEESRRTRHDIRHHLTALREMVKDGEYQELSEYLEVYSAAYSELDDALACGCRALDNILRHYLGVAREKEITARTELYPLSPDIGFDVTDLTVLMGNLMENAVEACENTEEGREKQIKVWIKQADASVLIKVENTCRADLDSRTSISGSDTFVSTKHTRHVGQGMKSIRLAAEKYGGSAEFDRRDGTFTARVVLNIP